MARPGVVPLSETLSDRVLLSTPIVSVGEFRCRAGDPLWSRENVTEGNIVAFPRVPVFIAQADREPVVADANRVMFYKAGHAYTRARISDAGDESEFFSVDRKVAEQVVGDARGERLDGDADLFPFAEGPSRSRAYAAQRLIYEHVKASPRPDVLGVEAAFLGVFATIVEDALRARGVRRPRPEPTRRAQAEVVEIARSILAADPASTLSLSELASRVEVSPCHLCRIFRVHTGMTITRFRDRLRLRSTLEPLAARASDLTSIAHAAGFCSHSHFSWAFRREFAMTPSRFRSDASRTDARHLINLMTAA